MQWILVGGLAVGEALLMAGIVPAYWRFNARQPIWARPLNYVIGCTGLLLGFAIWAAATPEGATPWEAVGTFAGLLAGAGLGTISGYAWQWWQARRLAAEIAATEAQHGQH